MNTEVRTDQQTDQLYRVSGIVNSKQICFIKKKF